MDRYILKGGMLNMNTRKVCHWLCGVSVLFLFARNAAPVEVATHDGLSLRIDNKTGEITAICIGSRDVLLLKGVPSGFSVQEFSPVTALPNLAPNGSFEEKEGENPTGYRMIGNYVSWDQTHNHTPGGNVSARVSLPKEVSKESPASSGEIQSDFIPALPNTLYHFSAWGMVGKGGSGGNVFVRELDQERKILWEGKSHVQHALTWGTELYGGWTQKSITFRTKPECRFFQIYGNIWKGWGEFWFDDVRLVSIIPVEEKKLEGKLERKGDGFQQQLRLGKDKNVLMDVRYHPCRDYILVEAELSDLSPTEGGRALRITFTLPADGRGWWWHDDMQFKRQIESGQTYENLIGTWVSHRFSNYPLACISNDKFGLALAVPMDELVVQKFCYDPQVGLCTTFDIGLSPLTTRIGPGKAKFSFIIFHTDPAWGFRAALKRYYEFFPQFFVKRVKEEGLWFYAVPMRPISNPEDFGLCFYEGYIEDELEYAKSKGILVFPYIEPWGLRQEFPDVKELKDMPPYEERLRLVKEWAQTESDKKWEGGPRQEVAQAVLNSLPLLADGKAPFKVDKYAYWAQWWMLNTDPDISVPNRAVTCKKYRVEPYLPKVAGIYFDSVTVWLGNYENFRPEHFASSNAPLSFSPVWDKPCLPGFFSHVEFAQWLTSDLHTQGKLALFNLFPEGNRYFAHLSDIMGSEVGSFGYPANRKLHEVESDARANAKRTLAYQKAISNLLQEGNHMTGDEGVPALTHEQVEQYIKHQLFYGIWPGISTIGGSEKRDYLHWKRYFSSPEFYERDRDLFRKYIPILRRITQAGWEPVTYATTSDPKVLIERFGYWEKGNLCFTIRNSTPAENKVTVSVDMANLAKPIPVIDSLVAEEVISGNVLPLRLGKRKGSVEFDLSLGGFDTRVVVMKAR